MANSWIVITGASRGLGAFLVNAYWDLGWNIVLVSRNDGALSKVADGLVKHSDQLAITFSCDLSKPHEVTQLIAKLNSRLPRLDALINNAAIHGPIGPLVSNDLELWRDSFQINLHSPVSLCQGLIPLMIKTGGGSIINLSGGGATGPRANFTAYASAKAALVRFSESLAEEVLSHNVRVNCIAPGAMQTELLGEVITSGPTVAGQREYVLAENTFKSSGASMERVANLAHYLTSNESQGISGKLISAVWDNWQEWNKHLDKLNAGDLYTLRRITGKDRNEGWGDL
jgi:3-oxoacyl-[acyl-carrier protein] reductase